MKQVNTLDALFLPHRKLKALVQDIPTPFYLYDESGLRRSVQAVLSAFSWNVGHRQHFPMRQLPNPAILQILREEGCGVRCCSTAELKLAKDCGFSGESVVYAPMLPDAAGLMLTRELSAVLSLDSPAAISAAFCCKNLPETVALVYNPGGRFMVQGIAVSHAGRSKLGMSRAQILEWAPVLLRSGVKRLGLEADLLSQTLETEYYAAVARLLLGLAYELRDVGVETAFCGLGGGPGLGFLQGQANADLPAMAERVRQSIPEQWSTPLWTSVDCLLTGPYGYLFSRVLAVKSLARECVILDTSYANFSRALQMAYHHISVLGKPQIEGRRAMDVCGCLPEARDRFARMRPLPEVVPGDILIFHDAGFGADAMQMTYGGGSACRAYLCTPAGELREI